MNKRQKTYKEYLEPQSEFSHRFSSRARNHRGWAKMKAFNRRLAKRRLRRIVRKEIEVDVNE